VPNNSSSGSFHGRSSRGFRPSAGGHFHAHQFLFTADFDDFAPPVGAKEHVHLGHAGLLKERKIKTSRSQQGTVKENCLCSQKEKKAEIAEHTLHQTYLRKPGRTVKLFSFYLQ
jgi:hypothetical protein